MRAHEAMDCVDEELAAWDGEAIGRVDGVIVDRESGDPRWLLARLRGETGYVAVPLGVVQRGAGHVDVPWARDALADAPRVPRDGALTARAERRLCAFFGVEPTPGVRQSLWERRRTTARAVRRPDGELSWEPRPRHEYVPRAATS